MENGETVFYSKAFLPNNSWVYHSWTIYWNPKTESWRLILHMGHPEDSGLDYKYTREENAQMDQEHLLTNKFDFTLHKK